MPPLLSKRLPGLKVAGLQLDAVEETDDGSLLADTSCPLEAFATGFLVTVSFLRGSDFITLLLNLILTRFESDWNTLRQDQ